MRSNFYEIINAPPLGYAYADGAFVLSASVEDALYEGGALVMTGGDPDYEVVAEFHRRHPEYTVFAPGHLETQHVEGDDERRITDEAAQAAVVRAGVLCVWLPDFVEGSDADDGSRCSNGDIPCRLFFVFRR